MVSGSTIRVLHRPRRLQLIVADEMDETVVDVRVIVCVLALHADERKDQAFRR